MKLSKVCVIVGLSLSMLLWVDCAGSVTPPTSTGENGAFPAEEPAGEDDPGDPIPPRLQLVYIDNIGDGFDSALETLIKEQYEPLLVENGFYHEKGYDIYIAPLLYDSQAFIGCYYYPMECKEILPNIYTIRLINEAVDARKPLIGPNGSIFVFAHALDDNGNLYNYSYHKANTYTPPDSCTRVDGRSWICY
jgi:hypothetical protein